MKTHGLCLPNTDHTHLVLKNRNYIHSNAKGQHKVQELPILSTDKILPLHPNQLYMLDNKETWITHLVQSSKYLILLFLPTMS